MRRLTAVLLLAFTCIATAGAQEKDLSWPSITVVAHLDSAGLLHVRERQVMLFSGPWNGGERKFSLGLGQDIVLNGLVRFDHGSDVPHALTENSELSRIDDYAWMGDNTLRWRSRLPDGPVFDSTEITYVLDFTYTNVLVPKADHAFLLDHDFAFADRDGHVINNFDVTLTLDPVWRPSGSFTGHWHAPVLPSGDGYVVTVPMTFTGQGTPSGVLYGASMGARRNIAVIFGLILIAMFARLVFRERALGRFAALRPPREITPQWLDENVFSMPPEVAGASWDDQTSSPEVAAILARMVQEKKLSSSIESKKILFFRNDVLHLKLEVPRAQLNGSERALVDGLFEADADATDTASVRARYRRTGFDPASLIRDRVKSQIERLTGGPKEQKPTKTRTLLLLALTVALSVFAGMARTSDIPFLLLPLFPAVPLMFLTMTTAYRWRGKLNSLSIAAFWFLIPLAVSIWVYERFVLANETLRIGELTIAAIGAWLLTISSTVFNIASSRQSAERIRSRKNLAAAREYFRRELTKQTPQLRDEWYPYLIAFGLGKHLDRWFRAFGGAAHASAISTSSYSSSSASFSSSSSSSGSTGWSGFGGGGGFAGAGAGASFATAVSGMAASVPSPSSSSSSGGSSSGGSSGGGGGGGW